MNGAGVSRCERSPIVQSRPGDTELCLVQAVVRPVQEVLEKPQLVENLHRRRVDGVAAKIAEEVLVLFQHANLAAGSGEKQPGHDARRPAANDDEVVSHPLRSLKSLKSWDGRPFRPPTGLQRDVPDCHDRKVAS